MGEQWRCAVISSQGTMNVERRVGVQTKNKKKKRKCKSVGQQSPHKVTKNLEQQRGCPHCEELRKEVHRLKRSIKNLKDEQLSTWGEIDELQQKVAANHDSYLAELELVILELTKQTRERNQRPDTYDLSNNDFGALSDSIYEGDFENSGSHIRKYDQRGEDTECDIEMSLGDENKSIPPIEQVSRASNLSSENRKVLLSRAKATSSSERIENVSFIVEKLEKQSQMQNMHISPVIERNSSPPSPTAPLNELEGIAISSGDDKKSITPRDEEGVSDSADEATSLSEEATGEELEDNEENQNGLVGDASLDEECQRKENSDLSDSGELSTETMGKAVKQTVDSNDLDLNEKTANESAELPVLEDRIKNLEEELEERDEKLKGLEASMQQQRENHEKELQKLQEQISMITKLLSLE